MQRIFTKSLIFVRSFGCRNKTCSKVFETPTSQIDPKTNVVYGGDLGVPISYKSFGSILFERMLRWDRRDEVFQVCLYKQVSMTTRECLEKSVALAEKLKEGGLKKGDFVILVGKNSLNMNITLLGTVFAAAVPVPINRNIGFHKFETIVKTLKPKFFGCDGKYLVLFRKAFNALPEFDSSKIFFVTGEERSYERDVLPFEDFIKGRGKDFESFQPPEVDNVEEELVLGMKSSSNGPNARIVGITHHNTNSVIALFDYLDQGLNFRKEVILMVTEFQRMAGLYPLFLSGFYGSKLLVMRSFNEESVFKTINDYKVTSMFILSSKCWRMYKHTVRGKYDLSSCKHVFCDDGFLPKNIIQGWKEKIGIVLRPSYMINEIAGCPLMPPRDFTKEESCGKLVPNLYAKVVSSKTSKNVGPMEPGEICFKGPSVTRGYINDRKSSEELFDREGYLLTGHYGYFDKDGAFFVVDKIIHQIRCKNYKISPRELEGIIKLLEPVKDVCVAGIKHSEDGERPIAFVVLEPQKVSHEIDILNFVNSQVADYKKILAVVFVQKIPRFRSTGAIKRNLFADILSRYQMKKSPTFESKTLEEVIKNRLKPPGGKKR